jgi:hypothetical protein
VIGRWNTYSYVSNSDIYSHRLTHITLQPLCKFRSNLFVWSKRHPDLEGVSNFSHIIHIKLHPCIANLLITHIHKSSLCIQRSASTGLSSTHISACVTNPLTCKASISVTPPPPQTYAMYKQAAWRVSLPLIWAYKQALKRESASLSAKTKLNSMVWVRERTTQTERPPLVGEVIANFCGQRVPRGQRDGSHGRILGFLDRSRYFSIK